jgi:hypothetical protein
MTLDSLSRTTSTTPEGEARRRRRRRDAGVALVLGAICLAVAEVIHPRGGASDPAGYANALAAEPERWTAWSLLIMATAMLQLPAVLAWRAAVVAGPGVRLVAAGGGITAVALVALFAFGQSHGEGSAFAGTPPLDPAVVDAFTRADSAVSLGVMLLLALPGFHLGWPILLAGLARARAVPVPLAVVGGATALGSLVAAALGPVAETATFVVLAACLAALGAVLVRDAR